MKAAGRVEVGTISLDTLEVQEAVEVADNRIEAVARTWARLSEEERQTVQKVTDRICGNGQGEELAYDLDIRLQPSRRNGKAGT